MKKAEQLVDAVSHYLVAGGVIAVRLDPVGMVDAQGVVGSFPSPGLA